MQYTDKQFVQADLILRRGGHVTTEDVWLYEFLAHNFDELKTLYAAYGCLLMQHEYSFFFLIPEKDGLLRTKALPAESLRRWSPPRAWAHTFCAARRMAASKATAKQFRR
jgi:hypothetical protein